MYQSDIAYELDKKIKNEMKALKNNAGLDSIINNLSYDELINLKSEYVNYLSQQENNLQMSNAKQKRLIRINQNGSVNVVILSLIVIFILGIITGIVFMITKGV